MQSKLALLSPLISDSIGYGVSGAGLGALLASLTSAGSRVLDNGYSPRGVDKVVPKRIVPQPVYVDDAMAKRLAQRGVVVRKAHAPADSVAGDETSSIDPMQKVALWPLDRDPSNSPVADALGGGVKAILPATLGLAALGGTYYGVNKMFGETEADKAKAAYVKKRRQLNALLADMDNASSPANPAMPKVAGLEDALPWLIGVPALVGGGLAFGDGYDAAVARNPNIKQEAELDKFYSNLPDSPKVQITPVLRPKPRTATKAAVPEHGADNDTLGKVAGVNWGQVGKAFATPGKANDVVSAAGAAASALPAWGLSSNIDDPTYKWIERAGMPLGVGMMLNRRINHMPMHLSAGVGAGVEAGMFGGLRGLDAMTNRNPKAMESQADATKQGMKWLVGGGLGLGALGLGSQWLGQDNAAREATKGRRAQSRQLKKILETVNTRHGIPNVPGDVDGDGDVDDDDRALALSAGVTAKHHGID